MVDVGGVALPGTLALTDGAAGVVVFAHGSGSSRGSPRNVAVAEGLQGRGLATLLFDLLTPEEGPDRANVFDIPLLGARLVAATSWLEGEGVDLPVAYFGASTGGGAALWAATERTATGPFAVVSRGGRPDLARERLRLVRAPTLLIVGGADQVVLDLNRDAAALMACEVRLSVVPRATHLFEEPGALEQVARLAGRWFVDHLPA